MIEREYTPDNTESPIGVLVLKYGLDRSEHLILLLSIAPYYFGSPHAKLGFGQEVDIEKYAQEIVARRTNLDTSKDS